jgi:hypothetical protein
MAAATAAAVMPLRHQAICVISFPFLGRGRQCRQNHCGGGATEVAAETAQLQRRRLRTGSVSGNFVTVAGAETARLRWLCYSGVVAAATAVAGAAEFFGEREIERDRNERGP